jgi:hypothetical protein
MLNKVLIQNNNTTSSINIFEKFYLQQTNKIRKISSSTYSINTTISKLSSSFQTNATDINIESSNIFIKCFHKSVVPFLSIKDLLELKKCSKLLNLIIDEKAFKICIISNSVNNYSSNELRISIWSHYMNLDKFISSHLNKYFQLNENKNFSEKMEEYYLYISKIIEKIKNNEKLAETEEKIYTSDKIKLIKDSLEFIKRDIDRTFYTDFFIKEGGKAQLLNILERMCAVPCNVGYCQGMNFIIGAMLSLFRKETITFYCFNCMIQTYDLINLFAYNTPDYGIRVYQINYYVKKYIPSVYHHFKNNNLSFDMIYSRWLLTLFANYLEINRLDFPWTCFFIDKWKGLIKLCLIMIYELKEQLLKCDLGGLSNLLKEDTIKYHNNYMTSFHLYNNVFKVTNEQLNNLKNDYFIDLAKKKLEDTNGDMNQWEEDQKGPLSEYLDEKNKLDEISFKQIEEYKKLNEETNKKYLIAFKQYNSYMKNIKNFQKGIDKVATEKLEYEKIISHYNNAIENIKNDHIILQYNQSKENNNEVENKNELKERENENKSKKNMLLKEKNKLVEKYNPIKHEFDIKTDLLYKRCDTIDKYKIELDYWIKQKNEIKETMQNYLFEVEQKKNELIQVLSDKLKLSENYKKSYKF